MARYQIQCINKSDRMNPHERILNVGGILSNGNPWKITQQQTVEFIDGNTHTFFVNRGGYNTDVITAISLYGNKYIKTVADGVSPDNLLSLPECP